jgi:hypothetical protein
MRRARSVQAGALLGLAGVLLSPVLPAQAHHSFALFDFNKSVMLEGTVKRFEWTNPHSWIFLDVVNDNRQVEEWAIELPAAGALARDGWNKNFVKPGERLSVRINPLKNGTHGGALASFRPEQPDQD